MNFISEIFDTVMNLLRSEGMQEWGVWSYPLLTVLVIVEGRIVTLLAAVAASLGYMRLPLVVICAVVGGIVADGLWYLLGYRFGKEPVLRYGRWLGLRRHHLEQLQWEMQEHGPRLLFIAKAFSVLVIPALVAAGMGRVPFRRWFPIVLLGEMVWVPVLAVIGHQTTEVVRQVELGLHYLPLAGGAALLITMLVAARRLKAGRAGVGWRLPVSWPDAYITYQTEVAPILNMYGSMAAGRLSQVVAPLRQEMAVARVSGRRGRRDPLFLGW
ncbi:MAG: DedA family protein [Caldilineaceae bacterium]|nr:DedA family protein [Caldilineaceae bacterium]